MSRFALTALVPVVGASLLAQQGAAPSAELAEVVAGYAAKIVASAHFVSGRTLDSVLAEELAPTRPLEAMVRPLLQFDIDDKAGTVTCRIGSARATAVRTQGLGCTLARPGADAAALRARAIAAAPPAPANVLQQPWPLGEGAATPTAGINQAALARAIDNAFAEPRGQAKIHTRAVVVVHRGQLVAERYAPGYHAAMPLPGWSMTKTLTHALLGVREQQAPLALHRPDGTGPGREWLRDERRAISLDHVLTMTTGLAWNESYDDPASNALQMLFRSSDHAAAYIARPRAAAPGATFGYSSGATNLLCQVLRATFAGDDAAYHAFPREHLFAPLGMHSTVLETDPSGTFVGSSYGFATARDWARLGLLYAQGGEFAGKRLVRRQWIDDAFRPAPGSEGRFGRHLWLDADPDGDGPAKRRWPELPADLGYMSGHEGQYCVIVPSAQLVLVRLGCTKNGGFDLRAFVRDVLTATSK